MNTVDLHTALDQVAKLARGGKALRITARPWAYVSAIVFRNLVYPSLRRPWRRTTRTFFGKRMTMALPAGTDIFLTGGKTHDSELRLARWLINTLRPGDTFVDIGAHFGYFSLLAAKLVGPEGRVLACEAAPGTFALLQANTQLTPPIEPVHAALTEQPGTLTFYEFPVRYSEYNAMDVEQYAHEPWFRQYPPQPRRVAGITLSELLHQRRLRPAVIKIDVEGAEPLVIRGGRTYLTQHRPVLVMEYLPNSTAHQEAAGQLKAWGYRAHRIDAEGGLFPVDDAERYLREEGVDSDNLVFVAAGG